MKYFKGLPSKTVSSDFDNIVATANFFMVKMYSTPASTDSLELERWLADILTGSVFITCCKGSLIVCCCHGGALAFNIDFGSAKSPSTADCNWLLTGSGCIIGVGSGQGSGHVKDTGEGCVKDTGQECVKDTGGERVKDMGRECVKDSGEGRVKDTGWECFKDTGGGHVQDTGRDVS